MCGICGIVDFSRGGVEGEVLSRMTRSLRHRGPDDSGTLLSAPAGLGHTRLSIIDLSAQGHQPMASDDGTISIVYNGEIYNFPELKRELESQGVTFRTRSDTELALKAFQRWGTDAFARFNGMFAMAIWDSEKKELHLARDRFGIKPLYYHHDGSVLAFGSEIKAILESGRLDRRASRRALHEYLYYGAALGEHSAFEGVRKLLPGHCARFDRSGFRTAPFVSIHEPPAVRGSVPEIAERLRALLEAAVRRHLLSDVPVGLFLSGGIDSSTLTAYASRLYSGRLSTFSVDFDFSEGESELPKARVIAERFQTDHHEVRIAGAKLSEVIEKLVGSHDEPFGDAADIPLYLLAQQLRGSIKVVLQGDGGDEIFGGYRRYVVLSYERLWRSLSHVFRPLVSLLPHSPTRFRLLRFLDVMRNGDPGMRMALMLTEERVESPPTRVLSRDAREAMEREDPFQRYRQLYDRLHHLDAVQRMLYVDSSVILPDIFLEKVDKATMAHGLEVRVPFLDNDLASFAMGLPSGLKLRYGQKKWILKRAMRGILPDSILDAPKMGFNVPYQKWLRGPLRTYLESVLLDHTTLENGFFDRGRLERSIAEHMNGVRDNGFLLWKLLNLRLWSRQYRVRL
jgi:asparagine synthase (glutamine-hydrolysing)